MAGLEEFGGSITDREAFKAGLRQTSKNIPFFVAGAYIVTFLPDLLGIVGMVIAAVAAVMVTIFAGEALLTVVLGIISLGAWAIFRDTDLQPGWAILSILLRTLDGTVYAGCFYFIARSASWWGLF